MNNRRQRGVALISILLVVAIATVLATSMTADQHVVIHQARNFYDQRQATQYALGGEELARQILKQDFDEDPLHDHLAEVWASDELAFEFEEGEVELDIVDLQGRLNVNRLALQEGDSAQLAKTRMASLLRQLGVDGMFVARMEDWMDTDQSTRQLGAEDFDYLGLDQPYRSANAMMVAVSELRLLLDMKPEIFEALRPWVSALPDPLAPVNVNTAPPAVLQAIVPGIAPEAAEALAADRDQREGYDSVAQFLQQPELAGRGISEQGLGVQSGFFRVSIRARYQDRFVYLVSIIQRDRDDGKMRVIYRNMGKKILPVIAEGTEKESQAGASDA